MDTFEVRKIPNFKLYISHISNDYKSRYISDVIKKLNWGSIKNIRYIYKKGSIFKNVIIEFYNWYDNNNSIRNIKKELNNGSSYKLMHDFPKYWKCYKYVIKYPKT